MNMSLFDRVKSVLGDLTGKNRFTDFDFAILKTMLMLAAVDGEISPNEIETFKTLAEKCRGYNGTSFDKLWSSALHSAGYLLLQSKFLNPDELAKEFVNEAKKDFVDEIVLEQSANRQRAFDHLKKMASADGMYSDVERTCIEALFAYVTEARDQAIAERFPRATTFDH